MGRPYPTSAYDRLVIRIVAVGENVAAPIERTFRRSAMATLMPLSAVIVKKKEFQVCHLGGGQIELKGYFVEILMRWTETSSTATTTTITTTTIATTTTTTTTTTACELKTLGFYTAKPRVSLTPPNCDYFERVSLTVLDFWTQLPKLKI